MTLNKIKTNGLMHRKLVLINMASFLFFSCSLGKSRLWDINVKAWNIVKREKNFLSQKRYKISNFKVPPPIEKVTSSTLFNFKGLKRNNKIIDVRFSTPINKADLSTLFSSADAVPSVS